MTKRPAGRVSKRALTVSLQIRAQAVELARQTLASALDIAELAGQAEREAMLAICEETDAANSLEADDLAVEAFAAWLPVGRQAVAVARSQRDEAEVRVVVARAALAAARKAEAATQNLIGAQARLDRRILGAAEQAAADEAASRAKARPLPDIADRPVEPRIAPPAGTGMRGSRGGGTGGKRPESDQTDV